MLSLPLIPPSDQATWYTPVHLPSSTSTHPSSDPSSSSHHHANHPHPPHPLRRPHDLPNANTTSSSHHHHNLQPSAMTNSTSTQLARLRADEAALAHRKQNVRRFGAGWLRPPGVPKTFQATLDEAAERAEQAMLAAREQAMLDLAAATEQEGVGARAGADMGAGAGAGVEGQEGEGVLEERDLDADVPDAETIADEDDDEDDEDDEDEEEGIEGETFLDGSGAEGSAFVGGEGEEAERVQRMLELEEAEMVGALEEERDLDADVPDAGSYEHTDTEMEDESLEMEEDEDEEESEEEEEELGEASVVRMRTARVGEQGRRSLVSESGSPLLESSFMSSSPAAGRGRARGNIAGRPRPQGRSPPD
ncbi:MAG: hypothetical protein M1822_005941 [Bathelium mastoideum]|nr:MAG: hypothetical protein M1822_005941 [Bathelium mastoideum]